MIKTISKILILIVICLGFVATSRAQFPPACTFAQVAFNSVNNTFEYHCPNTNNWYTATVNGSGGGTTSGGLQDPGANGIVLRVAIDTTTTAAASDVIALFGGSCGITSFLRGDGTCAAVAGFTFPAAGVAVSPGVGGPWSASLSFGTGPNALLQLDSSGRLPAVSAALLTNFPTLNQNTTGNAATANALAATPSLCTTGQAPTGILTNGNATGCAALNGGLSGMTATQIPVAASSTTVTSSLPTTGTGNVTLSTNPIFTTPNLGTPSVINLTNATGAPNWNQSTTGNAGTATALQSVPTQCTGTSPLASGIAASGNANCTNIGVSIAAPNIAFYFGPQCLQSNVNQCYYSPGNTQVANDCTWASSGTSLTCATSHFAAGDVGKRVMGFLKTDSFGSAFGCVAGRTAFSSMTTGTLTISGFTSGTAVTLSGNPANTATSNHGCFIWGNPDDSYATTFEAAYSAVSAFCPKVMLAGANYWFSSPHFTSQPTGCSALPSNTGTPVGGNMVYTMGFDLEGRGPGNTVIYLGPDFPNGDPCTNTTGSVTNACFVVPSEGQWQNLAISGGAQLACQVPAGRVLLGVSVGTLKDISLTSMCEATAGGQIGIEADLLTQLDHINNSGWGAVCLQTVANTGYIQGVRVACENSPGASAGTIASVDIRTGSGNTPTFTCFGCLLLGAIASNNMNSINVAAGAILRLENTVVANCEAGSGCTNNTSTSMIRNQGGTVYLNGVTMTPNSSLSNINGLFNSVSGAKAYAMNTIFAGNGGGFSYADTSGATLYDIGGNTGIYTSASANGAFVADGHSIRGACTGTATSSQTLGLYGTGPNETVTACTSTTIGAGIPMTQGRSISALMVSATHAGVNASSGVVTVLKNGSTTTSTCTIGTGTSCLDITHNPSFAAGDLLSLQFTTQGTEVLAGVQAQVIWQ